MRKYLLNFSLLFPLLIFPSKDTSLVKRNLKRSLGPKTFQKYLNYKIYNFKVSILRSNKKSNFYSRGNKMISLSLTSVVVWMEASERNWILKTAWTKGRNKLV